jgi:phosphoribosylanthranilate isomerase
MTVVKICGITNLQDALLATELGADLLGFIFYPKSPRYMTYPQVQEIVHQVRAQAPASIPGFVGVFVDQERETVAQMRDFCALDYAQLHGSESPRMVSALQEGGHRVIKAFRVRNKASLEGMVDYRPTAFLLDTFIQGKPGGTGHAFDWTLAARARASGRIILAGGLTPDNVAQAISVAGPWGVDVSSGVEAALGCKDPAKLRRFITAVRNSE